MKRTYQFSWVLLLLSAFLLMLTNSASVRAAPELTIGHYELVSSKRITRTVFEYTYKADVTNTGTDALEVSATLSVDAPGVTVLDGQLSFGDVAGGARVTSSDTFTIRQDRQYSFAEDAMQWEIKSDANPTVQWTPSSLYESLAAGESTTTIAIFVPTANATNVSVEVLPELAPYVSVSPTSFASVGEGASYPVTVTMTAPVSMVVGTYDGSIQLRQGNRTLAQPLPVVMEVVWPTFDGGEDLGFTIQFPPGWYVDTTYTNAVAFTNTGETSLSRENLAFFRVLRLVNANPPELPLDQWFDAYYFSHGSSSEILSKELLTVGGRDAVRVTYLGIGTQVATYIHEGVDVINISYDLDNPGFVVDYEAILQSISFYE